MSYQLCSNEEKKLQKKLIPLNIVIAIIALVAAVSLIITPLLKINIGKAAKSFAGDGDSEISQIMEFSDVIEAELVIAPLDMAEILFAPENEKGQIFIDKMFIDNGLLENVMVSCVNVSLIVLNKLVEDYDELKDVDVAQLNEAVLKVNDAKSADDVVKVLDDYLDILETQLGVTFTDDEREVAEDTCKDVYDKTVEATGGSFSVEEMLCVNISPEGGKVYTSYMDFATAVLSGDLSFSEDGGDSSLSGITDVINNVAKYYGFGFIYVAVNALIWFILFLFAFFRMFAKNKRFTMWYVKLWGCWPCIIFGVLLSFGLGKVAAAVSVLAPVAGLFAAFSSYTWISGICYLLLWLFSICWAFPIKHKIRKLRKQR